MNNLTNVTLLEDMSEEFIAPKYVGYILILVTVVFWGLRSVPIKHYETGDGVFFQFFICLGVWTISYFVNCIRSFPKFYALPMVSGLSWSCM